MDWPIIAAALFLGLIVLLFTGLPIAFSIGLASLLGIWIFIGPDAMMQIANLCWKFGTDPGFTLIPLFILMAEFLSLSGVAAQAFAVTEKWLNRLPGSLGASSEVASSIFGACCGTSTGGAATMGLVCIPELLKRGYDRKLATGAVAAGGTLSIIIPPSGILILYGILTEQSIGRLFIAGAMPGLLITTVFVIYIVLYAKLRPQVAPQLQETVTWKDRFASLNRFWPFLLVILAVLGSIYLGIATATEAAAVGAFASLVIALAYRRLSWTNFKEALLRTARVSCFICFIIFTAFTFAYLLTYLRIPQELSTLLISSGMPATQIVIILNLVYLVLGMFIDPAGILVLTLPTVLPIIEAMGINPIWLGVLITMNMQIANLTPPVGLNLYVIKAISPEEVSLSDIVRGSMPFVALLVVSMMLVFFFPNIALWLPSFMR